MTDSRPPGDSELVEHELFDDHQTVEAPRIVFTTAKANVTTSPYQDWDMDPCMKATQGS